LLVGSGTHEAVERTLRAKLDTGALLEDDEVRAVAAESVTRRWQEEPPALDEDEMVRGEPVVRGAAIDMAAALAALHNRQVAPTITPTHVERTIVLSTPDLDVDIVTRIDVQTAEAIHDTKTSAKAPSESELRSAQFGLYVAAVRAADGRSPQRIQLDALCKTKTPKALSLVGEVTDADAAAALDRMARVSAGISAGTFVPADPTSWVCTPRFCGWYDSCPHGARKAVAVGLIDPTRLTAKMTATVYDIPEDI
jgi:hypothetical protein